MFKLIAESLGKAVLQEEDTIGGCTISAHRPSHNADGQDCSGPQAQCSVVNTSRVPPSANCTIRRGIRYWDDNAPCPQALLRQKYGLWDVVVLQDHSKLPSIRLARESMLLPTVREYAEVLAQMGTGLPLLRLRRPLLAAYMTWGFYEGPHKRCPGPSGNDFCFPPGGLDRLSNCAASDEWHSAMHRAPCQGYALARGYAETLAHGADVLVPAGLAWEAARGSPEVPADCRGRVDAEYSGPGQLANLTLPLRLQDGRNARWQGKDAHKLFLHRGPDFDSSSYCSDKCRHDHHASAVGMYLNALVFYATLFKQSPIGAAWPRGQEVDGMVMPYVDEGDARALQQIAHDVVMPHLGTWWAAEAQSP